jgi:hypothetical protein
MPSPSKKHGKRRDDNVEMTPSNTCTMDNLGLDFCLLKSLRMLLGI